MFTGASFVITPSWKQLNCASVSERINKLWHIYKIEYHPAIKKDELLLLITTWMILKIIMLSERRQPKKEYIL